MKSIFLFLSLIISSFPVFGQLEIKTNHRPDGITLNYINPMPVVINSDYELGLSLYKDPANNRYFVGIVILFKTSLPTKLTDNLLIQTNGNKGISLVPIMNKLVNMDGRDVAISMYSLDGKDIKELSIYPIKMISFNVNSEIIALHSTENEDLLLKEFIILNSNKTTNVNKNGAPSLVNESNSGSLVTGLIVIFFIFLIITFFIIVNKKKPRIIENAPNKTSEYELNDFDYKNKLEEQINIRDSLIKIESNPVNEITELNLITEPQSSPKEDLRISEIKRIGYKPSSQFKQTEPYKYPFVKMPKEDCFIKFPKAGRTNKLGYTERSFLNQLNLYFASDFKIYNDRHVLHKNNYSAYEPDFLMINEKNGKNIFINLEIDEPYDGISRIPTHELNRDFYRDLFFINRGYIVIRFTEKQIFEEAKECCVFISNVIKSIDPKYKNNELNYSSGITIHKQWDSLQSKKWALEKFRENYLGIEGFTQSQFTFNKIDYINSELDDKVESLIVDDKPSNVNIDDNKPLNRNQSHPRDKRIAFDPSNHRYFIDNNPDTISVSQLIDKFFPEFDSMSAAQNLNSNHKYYNYPVEEIIDIWKRDGVEAAKFGTLLHQQIEYYYKSIPFETNSLEFTYFLDFKDRFNGMVPYRTEWRVFDEDYLIAGTIDMVYKREDGSYYLFDWKRSKKVVDNQGNPKLSDPAHFYTKFAYGGLNHLTDDSYYKYALQQNIYRHILENKYDFTISSMNLLILHPEYETYHWVKLPKMQDEVDYMLKTLEILS